MTTSPGHPAWCSPRLCDVDDPDCPDHGAAHRSEPRVLDVYPLSVGYGPPIRVTSASLWQIARSWTTSTYLVLEADSGQVSLPIEKAVGALAQLNDLINRGEMQ